jgi:hypothetical protein
MKKTIILYFVIARMYLLNLNGKDDYTLLCNCKNVPVLKILNIMILLDFEYTF